jgi:hypothetical protein
VIQGDQQAALEFNSILDWLHASVHGPVASHLQKAVAEPLDKLHRFAQRVQAAMQDFQKQDVPMEQRGKALQSCLDNEADCEAAALLLEKSIGGELNTQKVQFLTRYVRAGLVCARFLGIDGSCIPTDSSMEAAVRLGKKQHSFATWLQAAQPGFKDLTSAWSDAGLTVGPACDEMLHFGLQVSDHLFEAWNTKMMMIANELKLLLPANQLLETGKILADETMQKTLASQCKHLLDSSSFSESGAFVRATSNYHESLPKLKKLAGRTALSGLRRKARLAVALNWAVEQIANFKPEKTHMLADKAEEVKLRLKEKGFGKQALS